MLINVSLLLLAAAASSALPWNIVRPCKKNKCIAENLVIKSHCNLNVSGFIPPEYTIKKFVFSTPYFNSTYADNDLIIRNHDKCYVSEFFFNVKSETIVLGLDCPFLQFESSRTVIQHYSLNEDLRYSYTYQGTYPLIRLTVNLPLHKPIDLCKSFAFADVTALPIFNVNPNDVKTANFLSTDLTLLNVYEIETFYHRANQLLRRYINAKICDFGCNF